MEAIKDFITDKVWNGLERVQQVAELTDDFELNPMIVPMNDDCDFGFMAGFTIETLADESGTWLKTKLLTTADFSYKVKIKKHRIGKVYHYQNENKPRYKYWIRFLGLESGFSVTEREIMFLRRNALLEFRALKRKAIRNKKPIRVYS